MIDDQPTTVFRRLIPKFYSVIILKDYIFSKLINFISQIVGVYSLKRFAYDICKPFHCIQNGILEWGIL